MAFVITPAICMHQRVWESARLGGSMWEWMHTCMVCACVREQARKFMGQRQKPKVIIRRLFDINSFEDIQHHITSYVKFHVPTYSCSFVSVSSIQRHATSEVGRFDHLELWTTMVLPSSGSRRKLRGRLHCSARTSSTRHKRQTGFHT